MCIAENEESGNTLSVRHANYAKRASLTHINMKLSRLDRNQLQFNDRKISEIFGLANRF